MTDDEIRDRHDVDAASTGDPAGQGDESTDDWACTLNEAEVEQRQQWIEANLLEHVAGFDRHGDALVAEFEHSDEALATVTTLLRYETRCCSSATFDLTVPGDGGPIRLEMTDLGDLDDVPPEAEAVYERMEAAAA